MEDLTYLPCVTTSKKVPNHNNVENRNSDNNKVATRPSSWEEAKTLAKLSIPTILIHLNFVIPSMFVAACIGKNFGHLYLDGFSLANTTASAFQGTLLQGLFNACDTFSPQAFGAGNYREVGLLAIRGLVASLVVIFPMSFLMYVCMKDILVFLGQDEEASEKARIYYIINSFCFPFYALFIIIWKFLSAQNVLNPLVLSTTAAIAIVLPLSLQILPTFLGFYGTPLISTAVYLFQCIFVLAYLYYFKPHNHDTWPGLGAWPEALAWESMWQFVSLGIGGMLAYLEWIYWEALSLVVGTLGVIPLSAHTIPAQIIDVAFMFPLGCGIALSILMGISISQDVTRTKRMAIGMMAFSFVTFGVASIFLYISRTAIIFMFTNEPTVAELCDEIWHHVCIFFFVLGVYGIVLGISLGLGMQWTLGIISVVSLWLFGMPLAYFFAVIKGGGLPAAWTWIWPPYVLIIIWMCSMFATANWDEISLQVRQREGVGDSNSINPETVSFTKESKPVILSSCTTYGSMEIPDTLD